VKPGEVKALENRLRASKRRRNRWLVVALAVVCAFALGYAFLAIQQEGVRMVTRPTALSEAPSPLQAADPGDPSAEDNELASSQGSQEENRTTSSRHPAAEESCNDMRVLVDRSHRLPRDYAPEDLVSLLSYGVPTLGGGEMLLRREAAEHLKSLVAEAAADGEELVVTSAYRSYADQRISYRRLRSIYGSEADLMSARPGHSQHQLGTAVDFTNAAAGYEVWQAFGHTSAYWWLRDHAREHGFVLAYPRGGEVSGYQWEPWHYRYVGAKNAERLEKSGLSLQEFLVRQGVMPGC
jgi:D-alanyl-D-alanine carboxypeptidase